jgi:hypothetical protein
LEKAAISGIQQLAAVYVVEDMLHDTYNPEARRRQKTSRLRKLWRSWRISGRASRTAG